ncbi:hypothetical protein [Pedobacter miscanthi]|uniref:hypothetical protein n=1 Tax=Pedobacter miscanthi TaxID=2259170 RepID=UPI002931A7F3|nr:hypothetical protein [Pedobacter miscanthi]
MPQNNPLLLALQKKRKGYVKLIIVFIFFVLLFSLTAKSQTVFGIPPEQVIYQINGDLDKDGIDETVYICDVPASKDGLAITRQLLIAKTVKGKPQLWYKTAIDHIKNINLPRNKTIDSLYISRNCIVLKQEKFLGGRYAEEYTHRFRFQNGNWYLIGSKLRSIRNCYGADVYEINFSTGLINIDFIPDGGCDDEPQADSVVATHRSFKHQFKSLPLLNNLKMGENNFVISGKQSCYY